MTQCSLVYKEDGFLTQFLGAVFAMATCSLECPSPNCTLGEDGARFKTPELDAALAMQLLMLHDERNHKQPVQMVEAGNQKRSAIPNLARASCRDTSLVIIVSRLHGID